MRAKIKTRMGSILLVICMIISILGSNNIPVNATGETQLNKKAVTLQVGEKQRLSLKNVPKNGKVTWRSTSKSNAAVSKEGIVTAKKQGKATIKAKLSYKTGEKNKDFFLQSDSHKEESYRKEPGCIFQCASTGTQRAGRRDLFCEPDNYRENI